MPPYSKADQLKSHMKSEPKKKERPMKEAKCDRCGISFMRRTDQIKRHKSTFCSPKCANKANGEKQQGKILVNARHGKYIICLICEKEFYISPSRIKSNPKFCSNKCQGIYQRDVPIPKGFITSTDNKGIKNGRYKDGKRVGTNTSKKKVREGVIKFDGPYCLFCGKPGPGLHLHRVIYGSEGGKYEVSNCVQLCNEDHELVHSNKKLWKPKLIEHLTQRKTSDKTYITEWFEKYREDNLL